MGDPWSTHNAYGPIHTILGYLLRFGELAPKFAVVFSLLVATGMLVVYGANNMNRVSNSLLYFFSIPL